jgi:hypothetical protein
VAEPRIGDLFGLARKIERRPALALCERELGANQFPVRL